MPEARDWLETVSIADLKPHPKNYRTHPQDQIDHLVASIEKHGMYRNVVIADDNTILAGHGVVEAARQSDIDEIPVHRVNVAPDDVRALEILAGDNEVDHLAHVDDRALTGILKEISDYDPSELLGTGYDQMMLANLAYVTRPASEIGDFDEAAHWVGLPEYEPAERPYQVIVSFDTPEDRDDFFTKLGTTKDEAVNKQFGDGHKMSMWWPIRSIEDPASLIFDA
jgi:hypothetical protein